MTKKKIIIISSAALLLIILLTLAFFWYRKNNQAKLEKQNSNSPAKEFVPEFLTAAEKAKLNIPADLKIQATRRNSKGELMVYKVIKNDSDIVDPSKVEPISSHKTQN